MGLFFLFSVILHKEYDSGGQVMKTCYIRSKPLPLPWVAEKLRSIDVGPEPEIQSGTSCDEYFAQSSTEAWGRSKRDLGTSPGCTWKRSPYGFEEKKLPRTG